MPDLPPPDLPPMGYNPPPQATYPFFNQIWYGSDMPSSTPPPAPTYYPPYMGINWQPWQPLGGQQMWTPGLMNSMTGPPSAQYNQPQYNQPPPGFYGQFEAGGAPWSEPTPLPGTQTPTDTGIAYGGIPAIGTDTGAAPTDQLPTPPGVTPASAYPQYATSGMMGYPPAIPVGMNWGGWGQPMGYFGIPAQPGIGQFGAPPVMGWPAGQTGDLPGIYSGPLPGAYGNYAAFGGGGPSSIPWQVGGLAAGQGVYGTAYGAGGGGGAAHTAATGAQ